MTKLLEPLAGLPDIARLPDDALLTRGQLAALTGFTEQAFKKWAREGRGPAITRIEGRPRTTVRDYRQWVSGDVPSAEAAR